MAGSGRTVLVFAVAAACGAASAAARGDEPRLPRLYLIGDSTVKNGTKGQQGWGDPLAAHFDAAKLQVENRARGGRSSRTFRTEGLWEKVRDELRPGDFVLIQFGHNDGGPLEGGRARASLKGVGDETRTVRGATGEEEVVRTYGWYIRQYVAEAKARGATAIVASPVPRNIWRDGKVARASADYGRWAREASAQAGGLFLDLNDLVAHRYEKAGPEAVARYFPADHTHTDAVGAAVTAEVVAGALRGLDGCPLRDFLRPARPAAVR